MRTVAIVGLIAAASSLCAGGPSADQLAGLMKAGAAIKDGASITTKLGGSTVSVTRQNGVVTCTVDGKPLALRVTAPAPKPARVTSVTETVAQQVTVAGVAATGNPLFQNPFIWIGTPNPNPPPGDQIFEFKPLAQIPGFSKQMFGWMEDFEFEACVLGLSSVTNGQTVVGPYGTSTTGFSSSGC